MTETNTQDLASEWKQLTGVPETADDTVSESQDLSAEWAELSGAQPKVVDTQAQAFGKGAVTG